jgi:hypothetical protein
MSNERQFGIRNLRLPAGAQGGVPAAEDGGLSAGLWHYPAYPELTLTSNRKT